MAGTVWRLAAGSATLPPDKSSNPQLSQEVSWILKSVGFIDSLSIVIIDHQNVKTN